MCSPEISSLYQARIVREGPSNRFAGGVSIESCPQCSNNLRPVNVITCKGSAADRSSLQVVEDSGVWLTGTASSRLRPTAHGAVSHEMK
jgi:hypothetical protein